MNDVFRHFVIDAAGEFRDEAPEFAAYPFVPFCYASRFTKTCGERGAYPPFCGDCRTNWERKRKAVSRAKTPEKARASGRREALRYAEKRRENARRWYVGNPKKVRDRKRRERDANYFRPFVAIDSEGQNYPGVDDIMNSEPL